MYEYLLSQLGISSPQISQLGISSPQYLIWEYLHSNISVVNNSRAYSLGVPEGNATIACLATDLSKATSAHLLKVKFDTLYNHLQLFCFSDPFWDVCL